MQRKSFEIPKALVWASYLDVRRNRGAPGCDGQTLKMFDQQRDGNIQDLEPAVLGNMVSATGAGKTDPEVEWQGAHSGDPDSSPGKARQAPPPGVERIASREIARYCATSFPAGATAGPR